MEILYPVSQYLCGCVYTCMLALLGIASQLVIIISTTSQPSAHTHQLRAVQRTQALVPHDPPLCLEQEHKPVTNMSTATSSQSAN